MKSIFFLLCGFSISIFSFSQPGTLDESFGDTGRVYTDLEGYCNTSAIQTDGKILAAGSSNLSGSTEYIVIRYWPNGSVDSSFGQNGIAFIPKLKTLWAMQVSEDGHILVCGTINPNIAAAKLKPDGSLDSTFGKNGIFTVDFEGTAYAFAIQLQEDGKIVLGGRVEVFEDSYRMMLTRINLDGTLDESFGVNGKVINNAGYQVNCLGLQEDGKIVAGGQLWPTGHGDRDMFLISRYNTNGHLDSNFGINGNAFTDIADDANDVVNDLSILNDGKIIAAGIAHYFSIGDAYMAAVKYNADGTLDKSFGENGVAKVIFPILPSEATGLLVQSDGKLILTGNLFDEITGDGEFALARLKVDGKLDSSFGVNGKQTTEMEGYPRSHSSVLQDDGKIVLAGDTYIIGSVYYLLARYNGDQIEKPWFAKIRKWLHGHSFTWDDWPFKIRSYTVERSADGIHFNEIARIVNTANQSNLSYEDNAPLSGINYYRLRAESIDGSVTYSNVIDINENIISIHLYPNPVKDALNIKGLDAGMNYELSVMSEKGSIVARTKISSTSSYTWNLQSLSKGVYFLKVISNNKKVSVKFVKE